MYLFLSPKGQTRPLGRRALSRLRSLCSRPIARYLDSTAECRRAFGEVLRPLASGHRCHRCHHFWQEGGLSLWWGHEQVFSRVYGVGSRGHRCILVTAVTVMTLMTLIFGLILDRGRTSTSLGHYPFSLTRRTRRGEQAAPYLCDL